MTLGRRHRLVDGIVLAGLVALCVLALHDAALQAALHGPSTRIRAFRTDDGERIREFLGSSAGLHAAIQERLLPDNEAVVVFRPTRETVRNFYHLVTLLYPRRLRAWMTPPEPGLLASLARLTQGEASGLIRPLLVADLDSGFEIDYARWAREVARGDGWTLWEAGRRK